MVYGPRDGLTAVSNIYISYYHWLGDFSAVTVERFHLRRESSQ